MTGGTRQDRDGVERHTGTERGAQQGNRGGSVCVLGVHTLKEIPGEVTQEVIETRVRLVGCIHFFRSQVKAVCVCVCIVRTSVREYVCPYGV